MRLRIEHTTAFTYNEPISEAYTEMRLAPLDDDSQRRLNFRLLTQPVSEPTSYVDRFGNVVHYFDVLQPHERLEVTAYSEVVTTDRALEATANLTLLDGFDYLQPSRYVTLDDAFRDLAQPYLTNDPLETAYGLMRVVHQTMAYEKGATHVHTTAREALDGARGVCQDYAHVLIAACRSVGIPARYVSGYLYSPAHETLSGASNAASHAWVDLFVPNHGWVALDPTHDVPQNAQHVRVATGRDYADVSPTRGVYKGTAKERMDITVRVTALSA